MQVSGDKVLEESAMIVWNIWQARNAFVWNNKSHSAAHVVFSARKMLDLYQFAHSSKGGSVFQTQEKMRNNEQWTPPVENGIKVNVDGAIFSELGRFGFGYIARNHTGQVLRTSNRSCIGSVQPEIAEVMGIKEALSWIAHSDWVNVQVETDSWVCVQAISSQLSLPSPFGYLVSDCQRLLEKLPFVSLCCIKRSANKAAHCLARSSCFLAEHSVQGNVPSELYAIIMADFSA